MDWKPQPPIEYAKRWNRFEREQWCPVCRDCGKLHHSCIEWEEART